VLVGYDKNPEGTEGPREPVFRYSVQLPRDNRFYQKDPENIYWFSVVAVYYDESIPNYEWGWTNHAHEFNDDAVAGVVDASGTEPKWVWYELYDQTGDSEDMSFTLFTAGCRCWGDIAGPFGPPDNMVSTSDLGLLLATLGPVGPPYEICPVPAGLECMDLAGPFGPPDGCLSTSDLGALLAYLGPFGPPYEGPCMPAP